MPEHEHLTRDQAYGAQRQATAEQRAAAYDAGLAEYHAANRTTAAEIAACPLCDDDGYRGARVCDHTGRDHYAESANGRALVRAELDKIRNRRTRKATA